MNHAVTIPLWLWTLWSMSIFCLGLGAGWWVWRGRPRAVLSAHARPTLRMSLAERREHADRCRDA